MSRMGDTCAFCLDAILDVNECVRPSAYPWLMADMPKEALAHRDCANTAMHDAAQAEHEQRRDYREAQGWPVEGGA